MHKSVQTRDRFQAIRDSDSCVNRTAIQGSLQNKNSYNQLNLYALKGNAYVVGIFFIMPFPTLATLNSEGVFPVNDLKHLEK